MYENGEGVPRDDGQAATWFRKVAEQGHAFAQYKLGLMYENGRGRGAIRLQRSVCVVVGRCQKWRRECSRGSGFQRKTTARRCLWRRKHWLCDILKPTSVNMIGFDIITTKRRALR